ncbi:MAG: NADPH:quinone oxidoreductase family protein [Solirubrobacteraceae bacterium]
MRAVQIVSEAGPPEALELVDAPSPGQQSWLGGEPVVIDVEAAGVSFPELLQTRGLYQIKPPLPFVPGSEVAGRVRTASPDSGLQPGQRVAAFCGLGGFAQEVVAPAHLTFALPDVLDFAQGAGLVLNYHTAYFSLVQRGGLVAGESVLVHGAAGGVGTAAIQVARALGARTIALVSSERKREVALQAGADQTLLVDEGWRDAVKEAGGGVDLVLDPVGGDRFTDSLRCLRENGRLVVVGFTAGSIPEVKVNRLLLNNISVVGAGWGAAALPKPQLCREIGQALDRMIANGFVAPIVGARLPLERAADALQLLESRDAVGKVVLDVRAQ